MIQGLNKYYLWVFLTGFSNNYFINLSKFFLWPSFLTCITRNLSHLSWVWRLPKFFIPFFVVFLVDNGSETLFLQDCEAELRRSQEKSLTNVRVSFFIVRFVSFNNENNGASSKDPLHVLLDSDMLQFK